MTHGDRDRGSVLPLVLVFIFSLGLVLAGMARYTATNLRYSSVVQERAAASASAEGAVNYAIQRLRANAVTTCENGPVTIAPTYDVVANPVFVDADTIEITCTRLDAGRATLSDWAAVVTGIGIGSTTDLLIEDEGDHGATGRIFVSTLRQDDFRINVEDVDFDGNLFYDGSADDCATIDRYQEGSSTWDDDIVLVSGSFVCWPQTWDQIVDEPPVPALPAPAATPPMWTLVGSCRVFEPGYYDSNTLELNAGGANYFRSGAYVFHDVLFDTSYDGTNYFSGTSILAGYPPDATFDSRLITGGACAAARAQDGNDGGPDGVTWYFSGSSKLEIRQNTTIEMIPMLHDDPEGRSHAVSIHVLDTSDPDYNSTLSPNVEIIDESGSSNEALFQGQIWAPTQPVDLEDLTGDADGQVTSGVVAAHIRIDSDNGSVGSLGPDRTQADHRLLLVATAVVDGVTVEARAVVDHRPSAALADRVAVRSVRLID